MWSRTKASKCAGCGRRRVLHDCSGDARKPLPQHCNGCCGAVKERVEARAQELAGRIKGNVSGLDMHKSYTIFMQAQRRDWATIHEEPAAVRARVAEILHPERTEEAMKNTRVSLGAIEGKNLRRRAKRVRHAELARRGGSVYRSACPVCKEGNLCMRRDTETFELRADDRCDLCGQAFLYMDIHDVREADRRSGARRKGERRTPGTPFMLGTLIADERRGHLRRDGARRRKP